MRKVSFYSYKGGVGRSLSLVNVAHVMAQRQAKKVGLLDLDIDAAGLCHILDVNPNSDFDLLSLLQPGNRKTVDLGRYVQEVRTIGSAKSKVMLIPTISDSKLMRTFEWDKNVEKFLGEEVIPEFGKLYELDYLLIDGRTGLSKFSGFAIKQADLVVLMCKLDRQNQFGISRMAKILTEAGKKYLTVVSGCPKTGKAAKRIAEFRKMIKADIDCVLPYVPDLYFDEFVISKEMPKSKLAKEYVQLVSKIEERLNADGI
ncbi:MAG: AAA family ATPase [Bacteroidota bacterium]